MRSHCFKFSFNQIVFDYKIQYRFSGKIIMTTRHPNCNRCLNDFPFDKQDLRCEVCFALDGRVCLGGSHPRADAGINLNFSFVCLYIFVSFPLPLNYSYFLSF